jgi:hypothetical protein
MVKIMSNNPLIYRYRCSNLRKGQLAVFLLIYLVVAALILFFNLSAYYTIDHFMTENQAAKTFNSTIQNIFYQFLFLELILLIFWGGLNTAGVISEERKNHAYDFFRLLPLSPIQKVIGVIVGRNLAVLIIAVLNLIPIILMALLCKMPIMLVFQLLLVTFFLGVAINGLALLSSLENSAGKVGQVNTVAVVFLFFLLSPFIFQMMELIATTKNLQSLTWPFFKMQVPVLVVVSILALYVFIWSIVGALRRFTHENEPLFTFKGGLLCFVLFEIILLDFFVGHNYKEKHIELLFLFFSFIPLVSIYWKSQKGIHHYQEELSRLGRSGVTHSKIYQTFITHCNLTLGFLLFLAWIACTLFLAFINQMDIVVQLKFVLPLFAYFVFFWMLMEIGVLYRTDLSRIGLLLWFVAIVITIIPVMISLQFDVEWISLLSPLGLFTMFGKSADLLSDSLVLVLTINLLTMVVPVWLVGKKYKELLKLRPAFDRID